MKKKITIDVKEITKSGKATIAMVIANALNDFGFAVTIHQIDQPLAKLFKFKSNEKFREKIVDGVEMIEINTVQAISLDKE